MWKFVRPSDQPESSFEKSRLESRLQEVPRPDRLKAGLQTRRTHTQEIFKTRSETRTVNLTQEAAGWTTKLVEPLHKGRARHSVRAVHRVQSASGAHGVTRPTFFGR